MLLVPHIALNARLIVRSNIQQTKIIPRHLKNTYAARSRPDSRPPRYCFRCTGDLSTLPPDHTKFCRAICECTNCTTRPGSHDTRMCEAFTRVDNRRREMKHANSATPPQNIPVHLNALDLDGNDSLLFRSGASVTPRFHLEQLPIPIHEKLLPDEEEEQNFFCNGSSTSQPLLTQRGLSPLERGTSNQHGNSTNRTPFAHLSSFLSRLCLLTLAVTASAVNIGLDTMCWHHFAGDASLLIHVQELTPADIAKYETRVASGSQVYPTHRGDLPAIFRTITGGTVCILFSDVLYAPNFDHLLNIGQLRTESAAAPQPTFNWKVFSAFVFVA
jgi:hypothetical protein